MPISPVVVIAALLARTAAFPAAASVQPAPTAVGPLVVMDLPRGMMLRDVALSADGKTAYAQVDIAEMSVRAPLVCLWPEWMGAILLGVSVVALIRMRRKLRAPIPEGEEYCGGCRYPLRGLPGNRCPECGLELTAANRVGPPHRMMVLRHLALAIAPPLILFAATPRLPRYEGPLDGPYSETLYRCMLWLNLIAPLEIPRHGGGPIAGRRDVAAVLELDLQEGSIVRVLHRGGEARRGGAAVSADGEFHFTAGDFGVLQTRSSDGSVTRVLAGPQPPEWAWTQLGRDGRMLYAGFMPWSRDEVGLPNWCAWDIATGRRLDSDEPAERRPLRTWSEEERRLRGVPVPVGEYWYGSPGVLSPGRRWYFSPHGPAAAFQPGASADGEWRFGPGIAVYDTRLRRWLPHIPLPADREAGALTVSADGRRLLGHGGHRGKGGHWNAWSDIITYDISAFAAEDAQRRDGVRDGPSRECARSGRK